MQGLVRKTDKKARLTLFGDFADQLVIVERVSDDEVRVKKARAVPRRYSLAQLVGAITSENRHDEIDWGPARGAEAW
jgi:antitoxin component of MazEF toxin-antitoxin module